MRHIAESSIWVGHAGDGRNLPSLRAAGIVAIVDLAMSEAPIVAPREMVVCRFPLVDGGGNDRWVLRAAIETVASLHQSGTSALVCCGAGMSRSPAVVAAAFAVAEGRDPRDCLARVVRGAPADIAPALWGEVCAAVGSAG